MLSLMNHAVGDESVQTPTDMHGVMMGPFYRRQLLEEVETLLSRVFASYFHTHAHTNVYAFVDPSRHTHI